MPRTQTRGDEAVQWIEQFCVCPLGPDKGRRVKLTPSQRDTVRKIYDNPSGPQDLPVADPLAAYLALLHTCGHEALARDFRPALGVDIFSTWNATSPELKAVLKCEGGRIVCPELGTRYPAAV
jgi:hypothetical protein